MAQSSPKNSAAAGQKPVKVFRLRGVKASVFENHANENVFHKVSLQRIYRDGEQFKTTTSLSRDDLPVARHLLQKSWEFILEAEAMKKPQEGDE